MSIANEAVDSAPAPVCSNGADPIKPTAKEAVESILGEVDWLSDQEGLCECPGRTMHTTHNGHRDCKVYLDQVPTLSCFHGSCKPVVDETNKLLRQRLSDGTLGTKKGKFTPEDKERLRERERRESIRKRAAHSKPGILTTWRWTYEAIIQDSPVDLKNNISEHWRLLLNCFQPDDVVWIGDKYDSGKQEHQGHFRSVSDWQSEVVAPAQFVCPAVFKPGSYSRANDNIQARRFLVVESDVLGKDEVGAVFRWLEQAVELNLCAIVDTAGKSLHAWFEYPPETIVDELKLVLPELSCDPKLFTPSQPVRLPGAMRDGKHQRLVYLRKEAK